MIVTTEAGGARRSVPGPIYAQKELQDQPKVLVVIVNYNAGDFLVRAVEALKRQTFTDYRLIVVDNASEDHSLALMLQEYPDVDVHYAGDNLGFAAANNLAIRLAGRALWVALLNPDAFPEPTWLGRLMLAATSRTEYSCFACKVVFDSDPQRLDGAGDEYHVSGFAWRRMHLSPANGAAKNLEVFAPSATAALYRKDVLDEANGFDERYFCYYEDVDLGLRLRLLGHRSLYVADAVVRHVGSGITGRRSAFVTYHTQRNRIWTYVKNMPTPWIWIFLPLHFSYQILVIGLYATQGQLAPALRGTLDALRGLRQILDSRKAVQDSHRIKFVELIRVMRKGVLDPILRR